MKAFALIIVLLLTGCARHRPAAEAKPAKKPSGNWGYFSGPVETRWDEDGRSMTLLNELRYTDPSGLVWIAPAGSKVDGASIPRAFWSIMGGPFEGKYRNASVLHDVAYGQKNRPWRDVDRMFYNAMRCGGVGAVEAKTIYYALYRHGRHWKFSIKRAKRVKSGRRRDLVSEEIPRATAVSADEVDAIQSWIRNANPSLNQIEARAAGNQH